MTLDIAIVLATLLVALVLFVTEKVRMDVTALLVLATLALTGIVAPNEAISGFSNPAVITVWAMFILSEGLTKTGVANVIGRFVLRFTGKTEFRMIAVIMLTAGSLSAVMNNIGVAALMLPVVLNIARTTNVSPSKLLIPLAYGSLLGGLTTLIGTPPNLLISDALKQNGLEPFGLFDFTPIGACVMIGGILFVALTSKWFLPDNGKAIATSSGSDISSLYRQYELGERSFFIAVKPGSFLEGRTLFESQLGRALGMRVIALQRDGSTEFSPGADLELRAGDRLLAQGQAERLKELQGWIELIPEAPSEDSAELLSSDLTIAEATIAEESELVGQSIRRSDFRRRFGVTALLIRHGKETTERGLADRTLEAGDRLLLQCKREQIESLSVNTNFSHFALASPEDVSRFSKVRDRLFEISVPEGSWLTGKAIKESHLRQGFDLHVLKVRRQEEDILLPEPDLIFETGDLLTLHGRREDLAFLKGLHDLQIEVAHQGDSELLDSEAAGLAEATLSPKSKLVGRTPAELRFADRYGVQLLGIQRGNHSHRSHLGSMSLEFGDSFLLMGPKERMDLLKEDADFILLTQAEPKRFKKSKAILATAIMAAALVPVFFGWYPIAITAVAAAAIMVLTGCLKMEDAYRAIEWKSVFLIAGMLPMGVAIEKTGAAELLANGVMSLTGGFGPWVVIGSLYLITAMATTIIPTSALVVLMSPIVLKSCADLGISPHTGMMAVALAASASFTSPISHPANILVMGPGGYRFFDYIKVGIPLALVVFIVAMLSLPFYWPLEGGQ
ncbi:MAG: SLC13 family permease [Verrucomicrobiota bacterium]